MARRHAAAGKRKPACGAWPEWTQPWWDCDKFIILLFSEESVVIQPISDKRIVYEKEVPVKLIKSSLAVYFCIWLSHIINVFGILHPKVTIIQELNELWGSWKHMAKFNKHRIMTIQFVIVNCLFMVGNWK